MERKIRWIGAYMGAIVAITIVYGIAYYMGMAMFEDRPQSLFHSLKMVLTYFFTVGYASDYPSTNIMMNLVRVINITGWLITTTSYILVMIIGLFKFSQLEKKTAQS